MSLPSSAKRPAFERAAQILVWIGGAALIVMAFVITVEALMLKFFNHAFGGVDEITKYVFACASSCAFAYAVFEKANIRIDIVRNRFGSRIRLVFDIIAWAVFVLVFAVIAYRGVELAWQSYESGARSITPKRMLLFIPQGIFAFGLVMTVLAGLVIGWRALRLLLSGRSEAASALLSPSSEAGRELPGSVETAGADAGNGRER